MPPAAVLYMLVILSPIEREPTIAMVVFHGIDFGPSLDDEQARREWLDESLREEVTTDDVKTHYCSTCGIEILSLYPSPGELVDPRCKTCINEDEQGVRDKMMFPDGDHIRTRVSDLSGNGWVCPLCPMGLLNESDGVVKQYSDVVEEVGTPNPVTIIVPTGGPANDQTIALKPNATGHWEVESVR